MSFQGRKLKGRILFYSPPGWVPPPPGWVPPPGSTVPVSFDFNFCKICIIKTYSRIMTYELFMLEVDVEFLQ